MDSKQTNGESSFEEKSVEDVCEWLEGKNIEIGIVESFKGKLLTAIFIDDIIMNIVFTKKRVWYGRRSYPGSYGHGTRSLIPSFGNRLKTYTLLKREIIN